MTIQQYKGFTIETMMDAGGNDCFVVYGVGFKNSGYSTLNNAKGAITKHIAKLDAMG